MAQPAHLFANIIFYDNACNLVQYILNRYANGPLKDVRFPVDRFHFKTKHKATHTFCQEHCDPAKFPFLTDAKGEPRFNSSAAESTMPWLGSLSNTLRNRHVYLYNLFLNEFVRRRNARIVDNLILTGRKPRRLC